MRMALVMVCLTGAVGLWAAPSEYQNIMPEPKLLQVSGQQVPVAEGERALATIIVPPGQRQARIGADEINERMAFLDAPRLPVVESEDPGVVEGTVGLAIVIASCQGSSLAQAIIRECSLDIEPDDPGEQGYLIRFVSFRGRQVAFLCGSDAIGALYAAVTFRWLLERDGNRVLATVATVRDWPDFKWRGTGSLKQMTGSYPVVGLTDQARLEALKLHADWMLRHKLNFFGDYVYGGEDVFRDEDIAWMREFNAYLKERGMMGEEYQSTNVGYDPRDTGYPRFADMLHTGKLYFTWSDDELLQRRAAEIGRACAETRLGTIVLHCPDGGGPINPEMWNNRGQADIQRWGNDRAAADAHVFNTFYREIRRAAPDIRVVFVIYPYNAFYLNWEGLKLIYPEMTREQFEWAGREYFRRIGPLLPEDAHICVWLGERQYMDEFRSYFGNRPMYYWYKMASGWVDSGWLITVARFMGSAFYHHPGDIMAARIDSNAPNCVNRVVACQFAWNTQSEGAEPFTGTYYNFLTDNTEPAVVIERWGLRACRSIWGSVAGPVLFQAFNKGIIPSLIVQPSRLLEDENRARRRLGREPATVTPQMMLAQAEACAAAAAALDTVPDLKVKMDDLSERLYVYYLQRTHCLAAYARAHYHLMLATEAVAAGDEQQVNVQVAMGKAAIEAGLEDMARVLERTAQMKEYDPRYRREAAKGVFPAIPGAPADFPRLRESLEACLRRLADSRLEFAPIKHEGPIEVAIYDPTGDGGTAIGHQGWMMTLQGAEEFAPQYVDDLSLSTLANYEVLLFPQCTTGRSAGRYEFYEVIGRYVRELGGGVLYGHNSVGSERFQFGTETAFPTIGLGAVARVDSKVAVVTGEHPITEGLTPGTRFEHTYYDHWTIKPGTRGVVVLSDPGGEAIMVAGQYKRGRVIYDGTIMLDQANAPLAAEGQWREVFLNAVRWLARRK